MLPRTEHQRRDAEFAKVVELVDEARNVADPVAVAIVKGVYVYLIQDRVFEPGRTHHFSIPSQFAGSVPQRLRGPLQYSKVTHALIRLLALPGKQKIVRLLLCDFRNERDQRTDAQLRELPARLGHRSEASSGAPIDPELVGDTNRPSRRLEYGESNG